MPHNRRVDTLVLDALSRGPLTLEQLAKATGRKRQPLSIRLARLRREGRVQLVGVSLWAATG
jgi:DNA-binding HxlR family transcriptional regulator